MQVATSPLPTPAMPEPSTHGPGASLIGLPVSFLVDLLLRHLALIGELRLFEIAQRLGIAAAQVEPLLVHMRSMQWIEVPRRGTTEGDVSYALTQSGHKQADQAFQRCHYVGPVPVTLDEYRSQVSRQSLRMQPTTVQRLKDAMGTMVLPDDLLPTLGSALNSGKAIYLYGPSGSGKSYLSEHLVKTLHGDIWIPHALYVEGEVIQMFDPVVHHLAAPSAPKERALSPSEVADGRWVRITRPVVVTGGELTLKMLDLEFDPVSRLYVAPPQMKANNGILVVDDLGRQRVSAQDLLNRWIVPLDKHVDHLGLHTGTTFEVPFEVTVIFAANLTPEELSDPAFARRLGYKILIGALSQEGYREVIAQACQRAGVKFDAEAVDFMIDRLHPSYEKAYLPCIPFDVISKIRDRSLYQGQPPRLTPELIEWAWKTYFGAGSEPQQGLGSNAMKESAK